MAEVTQSLLNELFNYDGETGQLVWRERPIEDFRSERAGKTWNTRYAGQAAGTYSQPVNCVVITIHGVSYRAHRLIWLLNFGRLPYDQIDHIDGDGANNRLANLREVTCAENHKNMPCPVNSVSGVIGVRKHRDGAWVAEIKGPEGYIYLGSYETVEHASIARRAAEKVLGYHKNHGRPPRLTHTAFSDGRLTA